MNRIFNKPYQTMVGWNLAKLTRFFIIAGLVVAVSGSYLWYSRLYMTDERKFWRAIESSMSLPSVTRTLTTGGTGNQVVQKQQFFFNPNMSSASRVTFDQISATESTSVVTEGISFIDAQYSRYIDFETNQPRPDGTIANLDSVLGEWEENVATGDSIEQARLNYISELVTLVIFGNFDPEYKRDTIRALQEEGTYEINIRGISQDEIDGESVTIFPISVKLKPYVELLNKSFIQAGYGDFPPLDPINYREDAAIPVTIAVSNKSGAVSGISFGNRQEGYSGHGILKANERPEAKYTNGELERIVQEEIQGIQ